MSTQNDVETVKRVRDAIAKGVEAVKRSHAGYARAMTRAVAAADAFIEGMDKEIAKIEQQAQPAAEGEGTKTEPSREEMIKFVQKYITEKDTVWHTDPDGISDETVRGSYNYILRMQRVFGK